MSPLRVFLVDDHSVIREGLRLLIDAQPEMSVVGEACDALDLVDRVKEAQPDVVVMDVSMPGINGAEATELLGRACPDVKVLALTRHSDRAYLQQMLRAGALGYVIKRASAELLIHAIRSVAQGHRYLDPTATEAMLESYTPGISPAAVPEELSDREADVLRLTAWGHSNKEIGALLNISVKTVETHKAHVMTKLGFRSRAELVRYALRRGWLKEG